MTAAALQRDFAAGARERADLDSVDRRLIADVANARDVNAFERLYHSYRPRLGAFLYRLSQDQGANEELYNDVFLAVWERAGSYNGTSRVSTWIFAIGYRQCMKMLRKRRPPLAAVETDLPGADERNIAEDRNLLAVALGMLSPEHRMAIELSYYAGYTYQEIAAIAECPENTIKTRIFHARRRLQTIVAEAGGERPARPGEEHTS